MKIAILSKFSGTVERGSENWATEMQKRVNGDVTIVSGNYLSKIKSWIKSDIIIPTNGRFQVLIVRIITFFLNKPMIVFGHSGPGADDKWNLICSPNYFISFTEAQKKWAEKYKFPWTKLQVIPHAVDVEKFYPDMKKRKKNLVLCVAANTPNKRVNLVREAVKKLHDVNLLVVGSGQDLQVPHEKMTDIYNSASLFCFVPEKWEAFGLVYLEAMACNLPVVTINDDIRKEIVGKAGILVQHPENTDSLAKSIFKALAINWGDKPRNQVEKYSWHNVVARYNNLFLKYKNGN